MTLRWKITLGTLLAVTLGLAVAGWLALHSLERSELARATETLEAHTRLAVFSLQPLLEAGHTGQLQATAQELSRRAVARITVIRPDGQVLADSATAPEAIARLENHGSRPEVVQAMASGRGTDVRLSETTKERLVYLAVSVPDKHGRPLGVVRLALLLTSLEARIVELKELLAVAFGVAFIVAVGLSVVLAKGMVRPLSDMAAVARRLAEGTLSQRIKATSSSDEVGVLATTFNQMAAQLEADITTLRRLETVRRDFVANVSHELRTPLTSIKGYVEAMLDGAKDDPAEAKRFLDIILTQTDRLNLIIEDLLQLSQIESGQVQFKRDPVRLDAVVDRTISLLKPLADKKGHTLAVNLPADLLPALGDEERLVQVMTNLVDNAIKYTPARGSIVIAGHRASPHAIEVSVTDTGIGIPESDRPRVFERFYRVDKARSRELGGTGLGLAIVRHIVERHEGRVWVEGNSPAGSRFVVRLPAASA
jgi:signal transduction histidine kinase